MEPNGYLILSNLLIFSNIFQVLCHVPRMIGLVDYLHKLYYGKKKRRVWCYRPTLVFLKMVEKLYAFFKYTLFCFYINLYY